MWCDQCKLAIWRACLSKETGPMERYLWGTQDQIVGSKPRLDWTAYDPKRQVELCETCRTGADLVMEQHLEKGGE